MASEGSSAGGGATGVSRYDVVPYAGLPGAEAQCSRLEAVATLFGLSPTPPACARVLELGCGSGDNLIWQAAEFPQARFIGCDTSVTAVAAGRETIRALGLPNVELRLHDLCELDAGWGTFDYILCPGVFSWVAPAVRRRILEIFRRQLAPQGLAYVSYNVFPGWAVRGAVRDLVRFHARDVEDPRRAIACAREILALAAESHPVGGSFGTLLGRENLFVSSFDDGYVYHEMLADHNQPFYFEEFLGQLASAGLEYVGAAEVAAMFSHDLPPRARAFLQGMPPLAREQYLDFLRGSMFRSSVLCQGGVAIDRRLDPAVLERFALGLARAVRLEVRPREPARGGERPAAAADTVLVGASCELGCRDPLTAAALRCLDELRPEFVPLPELRQEAARRLGRLGDGDAAGRGRERLLRFLAEAVSAGAVEAVRSPPRLIRRAGERPLVHPLSRLQARRGGPVTNQRQEVVELSPLARLVAGSLDGSRDRRGLTELVREALRSGEMPLDPEEEVEDAERLVQQVLSRLCRSSLLVA